MQSNNYIAGAPTSSWGVRPAEVLARKSVIIQVFQMPLEHQRRRDANDKRSLADICTQVGKETDTGIDASRSGQTQSYTFVIKGDQANINLARRRLWSILSESATITLDIPEECLGLLIGPQGKIIKALMTETSTKITVPKVYQGQVLVSGDFEGISMAKQRIEALIQEKVNKITAIIEIERHLIPFLFNVSPSTKNNEAVQRFSEAHEGVKIALVTRENNLVGINVSGDKTLVSPLMEELEKKITKIRGEIKSVSTQVPKALHKVLIGLKGDALHSLQDETGCVVQLPPPEENSDSITLYAPEDKLLKGLQAVLAKTSLLDSQKVPIANSNIKRLLSHNYVSTVHGLEKKYSVHINSQESGLLVDGSKAEVLMAVMELNNLIGTLKSYLFEPMKVEACFLKHIYGKGGKNIKEIQSEYGVEIVSDESDFLICGVAAEGIQKAKDRIVKQIKELAQMSTADLKIDTKFYPNLIGSKGTKIQSFREQHPSLIIDFGEDAVHIRGKSEEVEAAKIKLLHEVEVLKQEAFLNSYTTEVSLSPEQVKVATSETKTGLNRLLLNMARDQRVRLSMKEGNKNVIYIQGLKKNADAFRDVFIKKLIEIADRGNDTLQLEHSHHALVIGKGGKNIKQLKQKYGVSLEFPDMADVENNTIKLVGPKSNLDAVKEEIIELVQYEKTHGLKETIMIPESTLPTVIGRAGVVISGICLETDTLIDVDKTNVVDDQVAVTIEGSREGIAAATEKIHELVKVSLSQSSISMSLEKEHFEKLIGPANASYRSICDRFAAQTVHVSLRREKREITIRGPTELVEEAKKEIVQLLQTTFIQKVLAIPNRFHGMIIGSQGSTVKKLSEEHMVNIIFPSRQREGTSLDKDSVLIEGRPEAISAIVPILLVTPRL